MAAGKLTTTNTVDSSQKVLWLQLLMVMVIPFIAMLAWMLHAPLFPLIEQEFNVTNTMFGMITSITVMAHCAMQLPSGQITDMLGGKRTVTLGTAIMGIAIVISALAPNFTTLLVFRLILGLGTAISFISGLAFAREFVPAKRVMVVQGVYGGMGSLGFLVALLGSERFAIAISWRGEFLVLGVLVLAFAGLLLVGLKDGARKASPAVTSWRQTLSKRYLLILGIALGLTYGVFVALVTWVATMLFRQYGIGIEWAGPFAAIMNVTAVLGRFNSGMAQGRERWVIVATPLSTAVLTALLPLMPSTPLVLIVMLLLGLTANLAFGVIFAYPALLTTTGVSGRDLSVINFIGNIGALSFPLVIGWALDTSGSFVVGFSIVTVIGLIGSGVVGWRLPQARAREVKTQ